MPKLGEGTIYRNGKKFAVRYWFENRQRYRGGFKSKADAVTFLAEISIKKSKAEPIPAEAHKITVNELLETAITHGKTIKPLRSIADKENRKKNLLKYFDGWKASQITPYEVERYAAARLKTVKPATVNRELDVLRHAFGLAFKNCLIAYKPYIGRLQGEETRTVTFSDKERNTFRTHLPEDVRAVFDFQDETGSRISEVTSLRWSQVDFENEVVVWQITKSGEGKVYPFSNRLRSMLKNQREIVDRLQKELKQLIPYVFPRTAPDQVKGTPMIYWDKWQQREKTCKWFYERWRDALNAAKLTDRKTHDLRRGAAIRRDNAGVSEDSNMKLGGWKTPDMLTRYLKGKSIEDLRAAVKRLEEKEPSQTVTKR
jgi:integrase